MKLPQKKQCLRAALALSALGLGMSMPSCPGTQAMQQQIDALTTSQSDLNRKIMALDSKSRLIDTDMPQVKQILTQMTTTIQTQGTAIDGLKADVAALQAKLAAAPKAAAKGKAAPKRKGR